MQQASGNIRHATCSMRHAMQDATCNMQHACQSPLRPHRRAHLLSATCNIQHATCDMQHATCNSRRAGRVAPREGAARGSRPGGERRGEVYAIMLRQVAVHLAGTHKRNQLVPGGWFKGSHSQPAELCYLLGVCYPGSEVPRGTTDGRWVTVVQQTNKQTNSSNLLSHTPLD